jgi:putative selenate reductase molybdopterin-binding subunit
MLTSFILNGHPVDLDVPADVTLLDVLRESLGLYGAKHGCESGECGACTILLDGQPVSACVLLAVQAGGHALTTIESVGQHPEQAGGARGLDPLQQAFVETGAIQCGFCTPGMILAARALLERESHPTEADVREALSGVLCRCTGYLKPVQAVLRAAAVLRGEDVEPINLPMPAPRLPGRPLRRPSTGGSSGDAYACDAYGCTANHQT